MRSGVCWRFCRGSGCASTTRRSTCKRRRA
jgi:hypothetical protein